MDPKRMLSKVLESRVIDGMRDKGDGLGNTAGQPAQGLFGRVVHDWWKQSLSKGLFRSPDADPGRVRLRLSAMLGHCVLTEPKGACYSPELDMLLVADGPSGDTYLLDPDGGWHGKLPLTLAMGSSVAAMGDGSYVACDQGTGRLMRFDGQGAILESVPLPDQLPAGGPNRPIMAVPHAGKLYVLLTREDHSERAVGVLDEKGMQLLPYTAPRMVNGLVSVGGELFANVVDTGHLFRYDAETQGFTPFMTPPLPLGFFRFTHSRGTFFCVADNGRRIIASDLRGRLMGNMGHIPEVRFPILGMLDIHAFERGGGEYLAVTDRGNKCVYVFNVQRDAAMENGE